MSMTIIAWKGAKIMDATFGVNIYVGGIS